MPKSSILLNHLKDLLTKRTVLVSKNVTIFLSISLDCSLICVHTGYYIGCCQTAYDHFFATFDVFDEFSCVQAVSTTLST